MLGGMISGSHSGTCSKLRSNTHSNGMILLPAIASEPVPIVIVSLPTVLLLKKS
jgi:hypothetical protein